MTEYWFKPKRYGYGAMPDTWQGWALSAAAPISVVIAIVAMAALGGTANAGNWIVVAMVAIVLTIVCVVVCYRKTDGEWRWRWGSGDR
jgi:Na+/melibiose symporter-like transporter